MRRVSLSGEWQFRLNQDTDWRPISVPGCWETLGIAKDQPGPGWYRLELQVPAELDDKRLWLHFEGVSYHAVVSVNGQEVGQHLGLWDAFRFEVTDTLAPGETAEILVRVEKPASLQQGPASEAVPGNFPLKETLAGFLPYVWGHIFGGIWQDVYLETTDGAVFDAVSVRGDAEGKIRAEVQLSEEAELRLEVRDSKGALVLSRTVFGKELVLEDALASAQLWSPASPALYQATLSITGGEVHSLTFGFRSLSVDRTDLLMNGQPLYPRLALSWGWYPDSLHSNPGRERVREDLLKLKELGYNGVKLCLWVPPQYYFELADELGMLLWLELPMWLPKPTAFWRKQTPLEYKRIVQQVRHHPAIIIYSLGCELNREVGADILEGLYEEVKALVGDALLRDNSGSGEAYGGLLNEYADYYDYHFYSDIQFFRPLVDTFTPRWRPVQPWVFGEFCDLDTFRDLRRVYNAHGSKPWWAQRDEALNPQGARWQFDIIEQEERLRQNGFWERGEELEEISNKQALLHRKFTLELVRSYREISGYVITGERDTPISTAGMWDDLGIIKFPPEAFRAFNQDLVLSLGWDKRRAWIAGGDRAAYWDTFSYPAGATVRAHLIASHYGQARGPVMVSWRVVLPGGTVVVDGTLLSRERIEQGTVREVGIAEFAVPQVTTPVQVMLTASINIDSERSENSWLLWFFPEKPWEEVASFSLYDPTRRLQGLETLAQLEAESAGVVVATTWTSTLEAQVREGRNAILLLSGPEEAGPYRTVAMPFWREAVKVIEPHPAWADFPHDGWTDLQFFGLATDYALDTAALAEVRPILRRVDARTMQVHDYALELPLGRGRIIVSTLRFEGGLGEQPLGIRRNTAASYLLHCWIRYLQQG